MDDPSHLFILTPRLIGELLQLGTLLILSALFSGSETALTSMTKLRVKSLIEKEGKKVEAINSWLKKPNRLLITILVCNNLVNLYSAALMTIMVSEMLGTSLTSEVAGIATGLVTFLVLVFGEVFPKTYASSHAETISVQVVKPIEVISWIIAPLIYLLEGISWLIMKIFGLKTGLTSRMFITEEEIMRLVEVGEREGVLESGEKDMIHSVFEFRETDVREVMVPRTEMFCLNKDVPLTDMIAQIQDAGHSRVPIFEEKIDNIIGILYVRDLLYYWDKSADLSVNQILRPAFYVPEGKSVSSLLKEFQKEKTHLAIVVDEYGGTAGLVTIEDLLEEIVGEIFDEYDTEEKMYEIKEDGTIIVSARIDLEEANEQFDLNLPPKDSYETIGGFIFDQLEHVPQEGEVLTYQGLSIHILSVDGGKIDKVKIVKEDIAEEAEEE